MKIAVIGTHGVGKTSLVEEFAKVTDYTIINEIAREAIIEREGNIESQFDFQLELFHKKLLEENRYKHLKNVIGDRTTVDAYAYAVHYKVFPKTLIDIFRELTIGYSNNYFDSFVYLPIEYWTQTESGFAGDCRIVDQVLQNILYLLNNVVILRGTTEKRLKELLDFVALKEE